MKYLVMIFMIAFITSCSPEDGEIGPAGVNGIDGQDGEDGNANVKAYTFDISTQSGGNFNINFPELTLDILENDAVISFMKRGTNNLYYPIPGIILNDEVEVELREGLVDLYFYERMTGASVNITAGTFDIYRAIVIESTSTKGRAAAKTNIARELKNAGIDINDYYAVCDYYGIDY